MFIPRVHRYSSNISYHGIYLSVNSAPFQKGWAFNCFHEILITGSFSSKPEIKLLNSLEKVGRFGVGSSVIYFIRSFKELQKKGGFPKASSYNMQPNDQRSLWNDKIPSSVNSSGAI